MAKKEKIVVNRITTGETVIITISRIWHHHRLGRVNGFSGNIQPESLIITTPLDRKAFRINGEEIPLDRLIQEFPDIKLMLEEI